MLAVIRSSLNHRLRAEKPGLKTEQKLTFRPDSALDGFDHGGCSPGWDAFAIVAQYLKKHHGISANSEGPEKMSGSPGNGRMMANVPRPRPETWMSIQALCRQAYGFFFSKAI